MAGRSCWRLLAAFSLIFVASIFAAPALPRVQDAADHSSEAAPAIERAVAANLTPPRSSWPLAPVWIPPPGLPPPDPGGRYPVSPQPPVLQKLVRVAGIIFSGRVVSIAGAARARASPLGRAWASTAVTFQVENAVRGTSPGQLLTIHEWAGLWSGGERYRVGEHVLLFLYSPSKLGLTSPVAGAMGRFAVDSQGRIVMNPGQAAALAADPVLAGKTGGQTVVSYSIFVQAVRRASREQ
jgi:hypothetical protein